ncbi:MAG: methylated-DNA--[Bacteroidales bacterium]|nr:methylated-DNA--[protein]-cysteine S-methyltransferase [Bacteroidales bacterium]
MDFTFRYDSPLGILILISDGRSLTGLRFGGQAFHGTSQVRDCGDAALPVFADTCRWLDIYFAGRDPGFLPQLAPEGTPFRKEVWKLLLSIPYGETTSYRALAAIVAERRGRNGAYQAGGISRMSAQAIGGAVGHNPIPIIIPCHRVIAADGSIGGFSAGIERKAWLLSHEGQIAAGCLKGFATGVSEGGDRLSVREQNFQA